jgi:hypothetical protein
MSLRDASNLTIHQPRDTCLSHGTCGCWDGPDLAKSRRMVDQYAGISGLLWATTMDVLAL